MIYLNNFDAHTSYEEKLNVGGIDFKIPNVSYCNDVKDVHFNPYNLIKFYVGEITKPETVSIYTDETTSIDVQVSEGEGNKWYSCVLPKNKGLCAINGNHIIDDAQDIITKVIVKANINYYKPVGLFNFFTSIISDSVVEASFKGSNTSNVTNMSDMFWQCSGLTSLDVSGWDTSKVTNMNQMFHGCNKLETLDLSGWDTSKVTTMNGMFNSCSKLKKIIMKGCSKATIENIRRYLANEDITGATITQ